MDSLVRQTHRDIEILVVDNSSLDDTLNVVNNYIATDGRIKYFRAAGVKTFEARRIGMLNASGDYIGFCDADDTHCVNSFEKLVKKAIECDADLVTGKFLACEESWITFADEEEFIDTYDTAHNVPMVYLRLLRDRVLHSLCLSLFSKEVVENALNDMPIINVANGEDLLHMTALYYYVNKHVHIKDQIYLYYRNANSVSRASTEKAAIDRVIDYSIMYDELAKLLKKQGTFKSFVDDLCRLGVWSSGLALDRLRNNSSKYVELWGAHASEFLKARLLEGLLAKERQLETRINQLEEEAKKDRLKEVEKLESRLAATEAALSTVLASRMWRLSAPLRNIAILLRSGVSRTVV